MASRKIRYAVVGLGHIAQVAVLPAFEHAKNSELAAFVSDDDEKMRKLGRKYGVVNRHRYDDYDALLASGEIDAVYIALPNSMHRDFTIRAARAGVHVLCEKPMAVTSKECREMIAAARDNDVRLMIAYRLHFEETNMSAAEIVASGKIGEPRLFTSVFTMDVQEGDIRLQKELGGGPLYDIGVYCINAARYLFRAEPIRVSAVTVSRDDPRFSEVPEAVSATMTFPGERLASFTVSFGAADTGEYRVVGTKGDLRLDPAYTYAEELAQFLTVDGKTKEKTFDKRDQFAPELIRFSEHVLEGSDPEPSGTEGLIDVMIVEAIQKSMKDGGKPIDLDLPDPGARPDLSRELKCPPVDKPKEIKVSSPKK